MGLPSGPRKRSGLAAAGAVSRPSRVVSAGAVPVDHEGAAADAGTLGLDQVEDELDRDRRVGGAAARREDRPARLGGERVRGRHHVPRRDPCVLRRASGRRLGRKRRLRPCGACQKGERQDQPGGEEASVRGCSVPITHRQVLSCRRPAGSSNRDHATTGGLGGHSSIKCSGADGNCAETVLYKNANPPSCCVILAIRLRRQTGRMAMRSYNLFRSGENAGLCCAVPEDRSVPPFVIKPLWVFEGKVETLARCPSASTEGRRHRGAVQRLLPLFQLPRRRAAGALHGAVGGLNASLMPRGHADVPCGAAVSVALPPMSIVKEKCARFSCVERCSRDCESIGSDPKNGSIFRSDAVAFLRLSAPRPLIPVRP